MQTRNLIYRSFIFFLCFALVNLAVPESLVVAGGRPIALAITAKIAANKAVKKALDARRAVSRTRPLNTKELSSLQGRTAQCPYVAGANKWDPNFQGVDLITGNYSMTATDLSFDGGYGIPINITRSYSANDTNEGPFGWGWTLSADVRTTAGGVLKSSKSPVMAVPTTYKERAPQETDPNVSTQPIEAVTATDASGKQETIQKDADGVLSPAAWDQNQSVTQYQSIVTNGLVYQVAISQVTTTPDGTVYNYQSEGSYTNGGTYPYNSPNGPTTPANVLKCVSATDRNNNTTQYIYGTSAVSFTKVDGVTSEFPLTQVKMPNGHIINLIWGTGGTNSPANRVMQVQDNVMNPATQTPRTVNYGYTNGFLTSVTSPAGLTTTYGYSIPTNNLTTDIPVQVVNTITDPRGLQTNVVSFVGVSTVMPYAANVVAVLVNEVVQPNGVTTVFNWQLNQGNEPFGMLTPDNGDFCSFYEQHAGGVTAPLISTYFNYTSISGNSIQVNQFYNNLQNSGPVPSKVDVYDIPSQGNLSSATYTMQALDPNNINLSSQRQLNNSPFSYEETLSSTNYNFQGKPLDVTENEYVAPLSGGVSLLRTATTSYAYWGASKYYQQKAVKDPGGRIFFTDYNTATDSNYGNRGQKYQVFDPKYGGTEATTSGYYSIQVPNGSNPTSADMWRYMVTAVPGQYSGQFAYDTQGRATTILKLQAATVGTPSTYRYVTTQNTYLGDWGQVSQVVEDSGGINRTTKNNAYTSWGKPCDVIDGAGHEFQTSFDPDGKVISVYQVGLGYVATYTYGSSGASNGQPSTITDNLTGVSQQVTYQSTSGGGIGQVYSVTESRGTAGTDNLCTYTYGPTGDHLTTTYTNNSGVVLGQWGYYNYLSVGDPSKATHAFQTLCKLDGNGNRTPDEFHYSYDARGRPLEATFAQTPSNSTPDSNGYYDGYLAQTRGRAHYEYDAGGRLYWIAHYWDSLIPNTGNYTSQAILAQGCDHEVSPTGGGLNRAVKTDSKYYTPSSPGSSTFQISQTDSYSYDNQLDYLIGASYGDGLTNPNPSWTYDAAGNRNDSIVDNLNRATSISGVTCSNDILGDRLISGSNTFRWDSLARMTSYNSTSYTYRADGMRTYKTNSSGSTSYRYDGQMGIEDIDYAANGSVSKVTDYGLGARGIDVIYVTQTGTTSPSYPIYDTHGNMISTLSKQGTGYTTSALRTLDVWGQIRIGAKTGDPKGRYCANLGHKQDDESALVYMQARYYEPTSGRFISEDSSRDGLNWMTYCGGDPVDRTDGTGNFYTQGDFATGWFNFFMRAGYVFAIAAVAFGALKMRVLCLAALEIASMAFVGALGCTDIATNSTISIDAVEFFTVGAGLGILTAIAATISNTALESSLMNIAIGAIAGYDCMLAAGIYGCYEGESN